MKIIRFSNVFLCFILIFASSCSKFVKTDTALQSSAKEISQQHSCHNTSDWAEWGKLLEKYPTDNDILSLYALRVGLCSMILKEQIDEQTAIQLFDYAHSLVIEKARMQENHQKTESSL